MKAAIAALSCPSWQSLCTFWGLSPVLGFLFSLSFTCSFSSLPDCLSETRSLGLSQPLFSILAQFLSRMHFPFSLFLPCSEHCLGIPGSLPCLFRSLPPVSGPSSQSAPSLPPGLAPVPAALQMLAFRFLAARVLAAPPRPARERWVLSSPLFSRAWTCSSLGSREEREASWAPLFPGWCVLAGSVGRCLVAIQKVCQVRACSARKSSWETLVIYSLEIFACHGYPVYYYRIWVLKVLSEFSIILIYLRLGSQERNMRSIGCSPREEQSNTQSPCLLGAAERSAMLLYWEPCISERTFQNLSGSIHFEWFEMFYVPSPSFSLIFHSQLLPLDALILGKDLSLLPLHPVWIVKAVSECYFGWYFEDIGADQWAALAVFLLALLADTARKRTEQESRCFPLSPSVVKSTDSTDNAFSHF